PRSLLTEDVRPLGRLAFVDNTAELLARLRELVEQLTSAESKEATTRTTGLKVSAEPPAVFLLASLSGGASGGMASDLAYAVRQVLDERDLPAEGLCGLLMYASRPNTRDCDVARVNAVAALTELHHFSRPDVGYPGSAADGLAATTPGLAPFAECYVLHLGDQ